MAQEIRANLSVFCDEKLLQIKGDGTGSWMSIGWEEEASDFLTIFLADDPQERLTQLSHLEEQLVEHIGRLKKHIAKKAEQVAAAHEGDDTDEFHAAVAERISEEPLL